MNMYIENKIRLMKNVFLVNEILGLVLLIYFWNFSYDNKILEIIGYIVGLICLINIIYIWTDKTYSNTNVIGVPTLLSKPREILVLFFFVVNVIL